MSSSNIVHQYFKKEIEGTKILVKVNPIHWKGTEITVHPDRTIEDSRSFLQYAVSGWNSGKDYSFGIRLKHPNRFIGSCGMIHDEGKIQFGYVLSPTHWGKGYATEVCRKLMGTLRELPEIYRVNTFVDAENTASAKVLLKAGLIEEARLEKWFRFVNQDNQPKDCLLFRLPL